MSILLTALQHANGRQLVDQKWVTTASETIYIHEFQDAFCIVIFMCLKERVWTHYEVRLNTLATDVLREFEGDKSVSRTQLTLL